MCMDRDSVLKESKSSYLVPCLLCGQSVVFFPDDLIQSCADCGARMNNPLPVDDFDAIGPGFSALRRPRPWHGRGKSSLWLASPSPKI